MPIKVPVTQTGLEASIEAAAKSAGRKLKINLGTSAKSIEGLSQPLGRITGKADQFTKSMEAANARVLAFGASVGVLSAVTRGFQELVRTTIDVEKRLIAINSILGGTASQLDAFKKTIFDVAKNTEQSFGTVADAALELSRQGLKAEEVQKRLNDALVLSRLSGLGASEAVAGLTAAINSFNREGVTSAEVLNKLSAAAVSAAVSERDLIEGIKRSGSVAIQAGVSLDELVGVITAVQTKTARGGAVIGNSFKTIFTRIQSLDKLQTMQNLGVQITDLNGDVLSGTKLIENLAKALSSVPDARRLQIAENLVGKFQVAPFLAILDDYNSKTSKAIEVTKISQNATTEAYERNKALNDALSAAINSTVVSVQKLAETLGKLGVSDNLKGILTFFNSLVTGLQDILDGDGLGSKFAKGIVKGIGNVISGPGLAIFGAIIAKLTIDLAKFGVGSLNTFFGLNKAAKEQATLQGQIASTLLGNSDIQKRILTIENSTLSVEQKRAAQTKFFTTALNEQLAVMTRMQAIAARVTPGVFAGTRGGKGRAAGGFIPNYNAVMGYGSEKADINRGVGGAPSSAKPVTIPNFNFGGGQKGTMVANTSEYMVPNFAGTGGSAIFNQDMVASLGLPSGAKKVGAAGGYIPNFAKSKKPPKRVDASRFFYLVPDMNVRGKPLGEKTVDKQKIGGGIAYGLKKEEIAKISDGEENVLSKNISSAIFKNTTAFIQKLKPLGRDVDQSQIEQGFDTTRGAKGALRGAIGAAFEVGITKALDYKAAIRERGGDFDVRGGVNLERVRKLFGFPTTQNTGDLKVGISPDNIVSFYKKVIKEDRVGAFGATEKNMNARALATQEVRRERPELFKKGSNTPLHSQRGVVDSLMNARLPNVRKRFNFAGGYIPSFAGPLQEAVARETAAGLPINQVRINQDPSLRNGSNPMGLAITNTRDEPTGAIPNFAKGGKSSSGEAQDVMGGLVGKMLAVQIGFSALSGILGEVTSKNSALATGLTALNIAVSAAMTAQAFGGLKNIGRFAIGRGGVAARGISMMSSGASAAKLGANNLRGAAALGFRGGTAGIAAKGGASALMGGLKVAGGALLRFAGPIGLAATAGLAINSLFNKLNGTTDNLRLNEEALAEATKNATREFEELDLGGRKERAEFLKTNESLTNQAQARLLDRGFQGTKDKEQAKGLGELINKAFMAGATSKEVNEIISKAEKKAGTREVGRRGRRIDDVFSNDIAAVMRESFKNLANLDFSGRQEKLKEFVEKTPGLKEGLSSDDATVRQAAEKQFRDEGLRLKVASEARAGTLGTVREEVDTEKDKETQRINLINATIAKDALKSEIEIAKIKASALTTDEQKLKIAQSNKSLSGEEMASLEGQIKHTRNITDGNVKIADLLVKQIEDVEKLVLNDDQRLALQDKIRDAGVAGLSDKGKFLEILDEVLNLEQKSKLEEEAIANNASKTVDNIKKEVTARNLVLGITTKTAIEQARIAELVRNTQADLGLDIRKSSFASSTETRKDRNDLNLRRGLVSANSGLTERQKSNKEIGFIEEENILDVRDAEEQAVKSTSQEITNLVKVMPEFEAGIKSIVDLIQTGGVDSLQTLDSAFFNELLAQGIKPTDTQRDEIAKILQGRDEGLTNIDLVKDEGDTKVKLAKATRDNIDALKTYSRLLSEFTISLSQQAEQLKVDLVTSRDGASVLSNINEQLFTAQARKGGAGNIANAATNAAITGLQDQAFLAGSARESRGFTRQVDIVREQLKLKEEFVKLQEDEVVNEPKLIALKERILQLEKERLQVNETLGAKFEDEFIKSDREIQNEFNDSLVSSARQFSTTLSEGLTNAIAKGESLGDTLKQAAANFFLEQSKNNFNTALSKGLQIFGFNAGGKVAGGSGARDDVPALLTGGEFVMNRKAVDKYGSAFMSSLNQGSIPTMNKGGLFTPGTFGQGAMKGKRNLLDFATQSFTTGKFDKVSGGSGFASIGLEPQSAALTMFGRRNSPQFQKEQASKKQAFGLFVNQVKKEKEFKDSQTSLGDVLLNAVKTFAISTAVKGLVGRAANAASFGKAGKDGEAGRAMPLNEDGTEMSFLQRMMLPLPEKKATGGSIPYAAGVDTVPAMLSGGEFVMNAAATQRVGRGTLSSINSGGGAGNNGAVVGKLDELISVSENSGETTINITVNSDGTSDQSGNGNDQESNLALKIRDVVRQVIDDEKRLGGSLRQARA